MSEFGAAFPWSGIDLDDPDAIVDLLERAAAAHEAMPARTGSVVDLPARGRLVLTGDLHDHGLNLLRILELAALEASSDHHVLLQEVIHGEQLVNGRDLSVRTLGRLAALKLAHPEQVHLMMGNHEAAQLTGKRILKGSTDVLAAFDEGVAHLYGDASERVEGAVRRFLGSFLLAVRTERGLLASHSLPSASALPRFDPAVLEQPVTPEGLDRNGSAYALLWGRSPDRRVCERLGEAWGARLFVIGHQPTEFGYDVYGEDILVLSSDGDTGMALPVDLSDAPRMDDLIEQLVPLSSLSV